MPVRSAEPVRPRGDRAAADPAAAAPTPVTVLSNLHRQTQQGFRGRVITYAAGAAALLVLVAGLALLGVVTASLASWFVQRVQAEGSRPAAGPANRGAHITRYSSPPTRTVPH